MREYVLIIIIPIVALIPSYAIASEIDDFKQTDGVTINIDSDPPGVNILLNGVDVGETPLSLECTLPGSYRVTGKLEGYKDIEREMEIAPGETAELNFVMEKGESKSTFVTWLVIGILAAVAAAGIFLLYIAVVTHNSS